MPHLMGRIRRDGLYSASRREFPLILQMRAAIRLETSQAEDESTIPGLSIVPSQTHERRTQFVSTVMSPQHSFGENVAVAAGAIAQ